MLIQAYFASGSDIFTYKFNSRSRKKAGDVESKQSDKAKLFA